MDKYVVIQSSTGTSVGMTGAEGTVTEVIAVMTPRSSDTGLSPGQSVPWARAFARYVVMALNAVPPFEFETPDRVVPASKERSARSGLLKLHA